MMLAKVFPGAALDFDQPPAGAAGVSKVSGRLEKHGGHYTLTDVTTKTAFELQGDNLEKSVGHCIAATGSGDPTNAALIHGVTYNEVACKKLGLPAAIGAGAAGAGAAGPGAGLSTGAIAAIVGGGAVAAGLGGAAAAGSFSGHARTVSAP